MRAGGCTVQQALTAEAASIVKQAVSLAKRRGHAQVTPLHVANTMLASSTGLLRTACLQSHPHPLQCKALELCFNVALNRLPASTSSPMLAPHSHHPSLSNALVAAFKRAQAHQRRGSIENQQQPLLAVKIEIEQLIISILDDPSVSRVMREAGFSSTQVKNNVEQAVSLEITAPNPPILKSKEGVKASNSRALDQVRSEDVLTVVENLVKRRRRSSVIVGECLASCESVVRGVMERVDRGEVPEGLRNVQLVSIPPISFGHLSKGEVEEKVGEIRCLVKGSAGRGIVLYLGDLKWCAEFRANSSEQGRNYCCPVEHMMRELGKLVFGMGESGRIWLMGIATYQTYMRCRIGHPSLETIWDLHPVTIPSASLGLSLTPDSDSHSQLRNNRNADEFRWSSLQDGSEKQLICCSDCSSKFENEVRSLTNSNADNASSTVIASSLPSWLQQHKEENRRITINQQECVQVRELRKKWNSICSSLHSHHHHHLTGKTLNFSLISPSSSLSSYGQHSSNLHHQPWPTVIDAEHPWKDRHFFISHIADEATDSNLRLYIPPHKDTMEIDYPQKFKELNAENLKTLCNAMEEKVSWQKDTIPEIASAILQCRSGMIRRKGKLTPNEAKEDTWLFFLGADTEAKEKIARVLACLVFGSHTNFISIGLSSFSSTGEELRNKRSRAESSCSYVERLADAIGSNPHRVFFMEDIEQIDYCSQMGVKSAIERGRLRNSNGDEVRLFDAIIVLSCESFNARSRASSRASSGVSSRASSPQIKQKSETQEEECLELDKEISPCMSLDLNLSFEDVDDISYDDIGLLDSVDGRFVFKFSSLVE